MGSSNETRPLIIRGKTISEADINIVRQLIKNNPGRGITFLSNIIAKSWNWKQKNGRFKVRACRSILAELHVQGFIELPQNSSRSVKRKYLAYSTSKIVPQIKMTSLKGALSDFSPLRFEVVIDKKKQHIWNYVIKKFHYLGYKVLVGRNLKYFVYAEDRLIAALGWQSAVGHLASRDRVLGWDYSQRKKYLHRVANNARFLIMPWVKINHAASHILARNIAMLNQDWKTKYGYSLWLLESFVDARLFKGTCYRAANWICVGQTKGFRKEKKTFVYHGKKKEVYLYVIEKKARQKILSDNAAPLLTREFLLSMKIKNLLSKRRKEMMFRNENWDPEVPPNCDLTSNDIDNLANELEDFHALFKGSFKRVEQVDLSKYYLQGLLSNIERKSIEPMALTLNGPKKVRSLQRFMSEYKWDFDYMSQRYLKLTSETIGAQDGVIGIDSSEFPKKGKESVGVSRQYCGRLGKVENCQSGVFAAYTSSRGYALLKGQLFIPEKWFSAEQEIRRKKCKVPDDLFFKTKPQIAAELVNSIIDTGLFPCRWVACDTLFGNSSDFLDNLPDSVYYLADIVKTTNVWTNQLSPDKSCSLHLSLSKIAQDPALSWSLKKLAEGAKGPIIAEMARIRVNLSENGDLTDERWLFLRKDLETGKIKYSLSNAPKEISFDEMVRVSTLRWPVEQLFEEGKSKLGMDHYEHRSWAAWHRHMLYVALAQLFLLRIRKKFKKKLQP